MNEACVITINNTNYYVPCDSIDNLIRIDNKLVNIGSNTINLYHDFITYGDSASGYPRITCSSNQFCYIRQSYNSNVSNLTINSYDVINRNYSNSILLMIVIVGVLVCQLFKR